MSLLLPAAFAQAATLDIVSGALTFTDGGTENNNLIVGVQSGVYSFNDAATPITLGAGATALGWKGSGTNNVSGPSSAVTSTITINAGGGTNTVNLRSIKSGNCTTVNGDTGTTAVNISSNAPSNTGNLNLIAATVTVNAGTATSLWAADVTGTTRPNTVAISSTSITGLAVNPINYTGTFTSIRVSGSTSTALAETYNVATPPATSFRLDTKKKQRTGHCDGLR